MPSENSVPAPSPSEARALLSEQRFEEALELCREVRAGPPGSRALRALWAAFEQDLAEALLARSRAAQSAAQAGAAARWLGMLERLDPSLAERAERSWARRLAAATPPAAAAAQRAPLGAAAPLPPAGPAQPAAAERQGARPSAPAGAAQEPGRERPAARVARLLADDLGEWLLVEAEQLWFVSTEAGPGRLPLEFPGLGPDRQLCILRSPGAGFLAYERLGAEGRWAPLGALHSGLPLGLWTRARPSLRLLPRWAPGEGPACLTLAFERGVRAGQAQGLIWLCAEVPVGPGPGCPLRAPSLSAEHRLGLEQGRLRLRGPGPLRWLGSGAGQPDPAAPDLLESAFPPARRLEFELGAGRPPLWVRIEPLETQP